MVTKVTIYKPVLAFQTKRYTRRFVNRVLDQIQDEARAIAAVGPYTTGRLARSIHKSGPWIIGKRVDGSVGSRLEYSKFVEGGTKIHNIFPKGVPHVYRFGPPRRPTLKFEWHGRTVYPNQVPMGPKTAGISHPGQRAKHFLLGPLRNAALRHRMLITVYQA